MPNSKGLTALEDQVQRAGMCVACGACAGLCPYLSPHRDRVVKLDNCTLESGRCFAYCPRTETDLDSLQRAVHGSVTPGSPMGRVRRVVHARAADDDVRRAGQTGGLVTALTLYALETGAVDRMILTGREDSQAPAGRLAGNREEVLACAGSGYVSGPTLATFNSVPTDDSNRMGIVVLPCQAIALAKMKTSDLEPKPPLDRLGLVIGLFCTWALGWEGLMDWLGKRTGGRKVTSLDITPPPERLLKVGLDDETMDVPLDEIRQFIRPGCAVCPDMTAEMADLSVGTVEGRPGWNTVVIRSARAEALFNAAEQSGALEVSEPDEGSTAALQTAARLKKRRALDALAGSGQEDGGYLKPSLASVEAAAGRGEKQ